MADLRTIQARLDKKPTRLEKAGTAVDRRNMSSIEVLIAALKGQPRR